MNGSELGTELDAGSPIVRPVHAARPWLLGLIFWLAIVPLSIRPRHSGNVWSRYMTIESIVERGTLTVDRSPLRIISGSPDLIRVEGHMYSDKPPVLSALGAVVYLPLWATGFRLGTTPDEFIVVNAVLVSGLVGSASGLAVAALRLILQCAPIRPLLSDILALGFGFGSLLLTYGVTFNNHSVAAGCLNMALAMIWVGGRAWRPRSRELFAGLLAGLATATDLPAGGAMTAGLAAWLLARHRRVPVAFVAGCVPFLMLNAALQATVTGSPLPAEMTPEVFNYPGSYWLTEAGRWTEPGPRWRFGLEFLVGPQGWLTVTPVLAFGLIAIARIALLPGDPLRAPAVVLASVVLVLVTYYIWGVRRTDFAGQSFGTRHMLAVSPAVFAFAVIGLGRLRSRLAWGLFAVAFGVGLIYAIAGMRDPWSRIERRGDFSLSIVRPLSPYPWSSYRR